MPPNAHRVLSFDEARRTVEQYARSPRPPLPETVELLRSRGRVLAENVLADRNLPPFPRATRDGYAVRAADLAPSPATLHVVAELRAGGALPAGFHLRPGQAVEIMTGAPVPEGADAVVMVEYATRRRDRVEIARGVARSENVVPEGAEGKQGDILLCVGTRLTPAAIAVAASTGRTELGVYRRPRVAILPTGDEIVEVTAAPGPSQVRNSNSCSLVAQVAHAGGEPVPLAIAPDDRDRLRHLIEEGLACDLLLLSGGVSMGKYDLVEEVLAELGAEFIFTGAAIQPGRPIVFGFARGRGRRRRTYFFGLPGNPVSTMVCFELFARPMIEGLSGSIPARLVFPQARLKAEVKVKPGLTRFLPAFLDGDAMNPTVEVLRWQGSGDVVTQARANCLLVVPPDRELLKPGEMVSIMQLDH